MKKLLLRIRHKRELRRLCRLLDYAVDKMREHEHDIDSTEWFQWAEFWLDCLTKMDEKMIKYARKMRD